MLPRTPTSVLGEFENLWEPRLARVSLIAELDVTKQELNKALFCTGQRWRALGQIRAMRNFPNVHPAAFAVATAGTASLRFEGRNAWQPLLEGAGLHYDMNTASSWGRTFVRCLEELGLPTFPELDDEGALKYVARMLLHGGVPIDHLDEWFNVSVGAVRQLGTTDAGELQAWMVRRAEQKRLYGATVAVERFLRFGGEFAADFLDRSLELLERVRAGDGLDDIRVGLPRRYVERALELRELGLLPGGPGTRRQVTLRPTARPELRFDPYGVGIHLVLPPVEEDGPTVWHLSLDGIVEIARVTPPRPGEPRNRLRSSFPSAQRRHS